ncbi:MAG: nucleotidyltransferase domain-containing protein [Elusimicrobia bacterium]|nr:nucleotidyltransferase domain-containing protein [Elusimicrobiota bacterium]
MKLERYPAEKLKKEILAIMAKHLDLRDYRVFFFGSRVRGDSFPRSDIDLGIEGVHQLAAPTKMAIEDELENLPTLYTIELVDFKTVPERFRGEALKYSEDVH